MGFITNENHDLAMARSSSSRADPRLRVAFKYLNTPSKGSRHTDYTFVTDRQTDFTFVTVQRH